MTPSTPPTTEELKHIVEAALLAADQPLNMNQLSALFGEESAPPQVEIRAALKALEDDCEGRGIELKLVASGWRLQVRESYQPWIGRLWQERPPRYSRALLETLALIAYRQPITRGEIEQVRGVTVSTNIMRTLLEREWVRIVGHRDVPGRPALYGTTKRFLDYFNLTSLDDLPTLAEIKDIDALEPELEWHDGEPGQSFTGEFADPEFDEPAPEHEFDGAVDSTTGASPENDPAEPDEDGQEEDPAPAQG